MNKYDEISLPNQLDDVINEGVKQAMMMKRTKKLGRVKKVGVGLAAGLTITLGLGFTNPAVASKLPVIGNVFESIEKNLYFPGNYSEYATSVNETAYSNGIAMTLSEIFSDGQFLYVTYVVESEKPFEHLSYIVEEVKNQVIEVNQLVVEEAYSKVDFDAELEVIGISGFEGKFIDEHTFVGVEQYYLGSGEIPEEFTFQTKKIVVENCANHIDDESQTTWGTWAFKVPVKVNQELSSVTVVEGVNANGASIEQISMTPFGVIVDATIPEEDWSRYDIRVFDETGEELQMSQLRYLGNQGVKGIYRASKTKTGTFKVVIEKQIWIPTGEDSYEHHESETILESLITIK
ncbi:DUF4179 domain-containing protein [Turicibacter sanguinis]|uniref:DUF4179 domain-containing protein n=1 Tax=Turicibacter sanguinis TaxID=154288 RepID=UPI0018AAB7DC|nr:DUF4179 domain-containing protein [Turicibacter sanguinis]MDB8552003.1 DUF4179 domain-containing protein [Turicibacter sanguinis]